MTIQLIQGQFNPFEAMEIISQMIQIKIKYHESKIAGDSNEEDIKSREAKIKHLQKELFETRKEMLSRKESLNIESMINIV